MMPGETPISAFAISEIPDPIRDRRGAIRVDFYAEPRIKVKFTSTPRIEATLKTLPER